MERIIIILALTYLCINLNYGCPPLWYEYNRSCYRLYGKQKTFNDARQICQDQHGDLTVISDVRENEFIKNLFLKQEDVDGSQVTIAYIGLTDEHKESVFLWVDGSALTYSNWTPGEPNYYLPTEDYGVMRGPPSEYFGHWNDADVHNQIPFVCERPARIINPDAPNVTGKVEAGFYVVGVSMEVISLRCITECLHKCLRHANCLSANYLKQGPSDNGICVLNSATRKAYDVTTGLPAERYYGEETSTWLYIELEDD